MVSLKKRKRERESGLVGMPGMKSAIVLLLPLIADETDCDGLSEGMFGGCLIKGLECWCRESIC